MGLGVNTKKTIQEELKLLKSQNEAPEWLTWIGYQVLLGGYLLENETPRQMYARIARAMSPYANDYKGGQEIDYEKEFFGLMWKGWLSPSTPVAANAGTAKGLTVSCAGNYVQDDLGNIYDSIKENALLTKYGFGTSSYVGDLRARGSEIGKSGKSTGLVPWIDQHWAMTQTVTQGATRRGAWAGYLSIEHGDFYEVMEYAQNKDRLNLGILIPDNFIDKLKSNNTEAMKRYHKLLEVRMVTGRPYIVFIDRANTLSPDSYKQHRLSVKASNLCSEIFLHSDEKNTYTCVLSSMNLAKYDEWENTNAVQLATIFLDCVASAFIEASEGVEGLEKARNFTINSRALGLGVLGLHTLFQKRGLAFESLPAQYLNRQIFQKLQVESHKASKFMASCTESPRWASPGFRNSHTMAVAPTTSSALICGSFSQGIEPWVANVSIQKTAKGKFQRINPEFLKLLEKYGKRNKQVIDSVALNQGSCQHLDFLSEEDKLIFRTAFEIDQKVLIRLGSQRQEYIDQGQSLNLFFKSGEDPEYIHEVHKQAFESNFIKSLYYVRTQAGIRADTNECVACEG